MRSIIWFLVLVFLVGPVWAETDVVQVPKTNSKLSMDDLGFSAADTKSDPAYQHMLDKRSHMLKAHQIMGMITLVPMWANVLLASDVERNAGKRNLHAAVGIGTFAMYCTTASLAIFAPKPKGVKSKGSTKYHKLLAFIHFPAMILVPILGDIAKNQRDKHERVHGIAEYHGAVVGVLLASYTSAMGMEIINF
jgi:hypothetical protein